MVFHGQVSKRTPDRSINLNNADQIELCLQRDHHRKWGFVIFRCDYNDNADWSEFLQRVRHYVEFSLDCYNGRDLLDSFEMTVVDDKARLDGASKSAVRKKFDEWANATVEAEQGTTDQGLSQRYRYCVHVDEGALQSVVHESSAPPRFDGRGPGYINLISRYWTPNLNDPREDEEQPVEDTGQLVEGSDQHDVGWMKVAYESVMVGFYNYLQEPHEWDREFRRPPQIARG